MAQMDNQRAYARTSHIRGTAWVSEDGEIWEGADVSDLSSGGLSLRSKMEYAVGATLWFDLSLSDFLSDFNVKTKGKVMRRTDAKDGFAYGIAFEGLSEEKQVRIDASVHNDRPVTRGGYETD